MGRPPGFDRREVLAAVEREFRRNGYDGTSLDDISAATGLGRGSLYAAFGDKHALFLAALGDYCDQDEAANAAALAGPDETAMPRLRAYFIDSLDRQLNDPEQLACMACRFTVELAGRDQDATDRLRLGFEAQRAALAGCLRAAQRNGDLDPAADPVTLATLLVVNFRGIGSLIGNGLDRAQLVAVVDTALAGLPVTPPPAAAADRRAATKRA
jgi:TetR/AcrR family transcriptional regulator, transcriptional repressor for nem operon